MTLYEYIYNTYINIEASGGLYSIVPVLRVRSMERSALWLGVRSQHSLYQQVCLETPSRPQEPIKDGHSQGAFRGRYV